MDNILRGRKVDRDDYEHEDQTLGQGLDQAAGE
jgi:hypothetical protein